MFGLVEFSAQSDVAEYEIHTRSMNRERDNFIDVLVEFTRFPSGQIRRLCKGLMTKSAIAITNVTSQIYGTPRCLYTLPDPNGTHVYLRSGQYRFSKSFALNEDDSGTLESPIIYSAYPDEKVILTGGVDVPLAKFTLVAAPNILSQLPAESHGKVWTVNLKQRGIIDYGTLGLYGASVFSPYTMGPNAPELFVNGQAMTFARWPNSDYARIESVVEVGSNLRMWQADMVGRDDRWLLSRSELIPASLQLGHNAIRSQRDQQSDAKNPCYKNDACGRKT